MSTPRIEIAKDVFAVMAYKAAMEGKYARDQLDYAWEHLPEHRQIDFLLVADYIIERERENGKTKG